MASIQITIADEYVPGVMARMYDANESREVPYADVEEFLSEYASAQASGACFDYTVGPFYVGPVDPRFNADGTPYVAPPLDDNDTSQEGEV
jgi:hypothetical protein